MNNVTQKTFRIIEQEQRRPRPRGWFIARVISSWVLFGLALAVAAWLVAEILLWLARVDLAAWLDLAWPLSGLRIVYLPLALIGLVAVFVWLAFFGFGTTACGYRCAPGKLTIINLAVIIGVGLVIFGSGGIIVLDNLVHDWKNYFSVAELQDQVAIQAGRQPLVGEVVGLSAARELRIKDGHGQVWRIWLSPEINSSDEAMLQPGQRVVLWGQQRAGQWRAERIEFFP